MFPAQRRCQALRRVVEIGQYAIRGELEHWIRVAARERRQFLHLHLRALSFRDVAKKSRKERRPLRRDARDGHFDRQFRAVEPPGLQFNPVAEDAARSRAGMQEVFQSRAVLFLPADRNNQIGQVLAQNIRAVIAKHFLSGWIPFKNPSFRVNRHDRLRRGL